MGNTAAAGAAAAEAAAGTVKPGAVGCSPSSASHTRIDVLTSAATCPVCAVVAALLLCNHCTLLQCIWVVYQALFVVIAQSGSRSGGVILLAVLTGELLWVVTSQAGARCCASRMLVAPVLQLSCCSLSSTRHAGRIVFVASIFAWILPPFIRPAVRLIRQFVRSVAQCHSGNSLLRYPSPSGRIGIQLIDFTNV